MAKPKLRERTNIFHLEVYNYTVVVILTSNVHASAVRRGIGISNAVIAFHACDSENMTSLIFLPFGISPATIAHECFHCVWSIMQLIGAKLEDEVVAYTLSYLMDRILEFM